MVSFIPNPFLQQELEHDPEVQHNIKEVAEAVADYARSIVPVDTGELHDSIEVVEVEGGWAVQVGTDHWLFIEFGTSEIAAEPFMRPSIEATGLHR
jgi:HK97 gp10 family phage protein